MATKITPFLDDKVDYKSYKTLIDHYTPKGMSGLIPLGNTGESPTVSDEEFEEPNPAPIKFYLYNVGLISSSEVRLPLTEITDNLKEKLSLI